MPNQTGADLHGIVLQDEARRIEVVSGDELSKIRSPFVHNSSFDVEPYVVEEGFSHLLQSRRTIGINADRHPRSPGIIQQGSVFEVVIRVMMSNEDEAHFIDRHTGGD